MNKLVKYDKDYVTTLLEDVAKKRAPYQVPVKFATKNKIVSLKEKSTDVHHDTKWMDVCSVLHSYPAEFKQAEIFIVPKFRPDNVLSMNTYADDWIENFEWRIFDFISLLI